MKKCEKKDCSGCYKKGNRCGRDLLGWNALNTLQSPDSTPGAVTRSQAELAEAARNIGRLTLNS